MVKSKYVSVTQMCNDKSNDDLLREAIANFCQETPGTRERDKAFAHLWKLILKFQIPRTSPHPRYPDLLQEIQLEFSQRICTEFEKIKAGKKSFVHSLRLWMNWYGLRLGFRILDLDREDKKKRVEISLDAPIPDDNNDGNTPTLGEVIAADIPEPMDTLEQEDFEEKVSAKIQDLVCHPRDYPQCTCAEIAKRRFFRNPPQKWEETAEELKIPKGTLTAHWHRICKPRLAQIKNELLGGE
ncbi:MAG: hypothetical protein QNJ68_09945 [Microcoleaceae cyanobacterium MO_207.B10]|nr:hypothetical protein [Microcoleaceae cyanobacterium MO_207.B10]